MRKPSAAIILFALLFPGHSCLSQDTPVEWRITYELLPSGGEILLSFSSEILNGWHLYSQFLEDGGPVPTTFTFYASKEYAITGRAAEHGIPTRYFDQLFDMNVTWYASHVSFQQKIKLARTSTVIRGYIEYMACNDSLCLPDKKEFRIDVHL
jgi:thiol:disulfide interchange protein DsbD